MNKTPRGIYLPDGTVHRFAEGKATRGLTDHIATRDRSPDFTALGMYLPNPDPILKKMGKDVDVYRDLRSDAHVGGCVRRRKAAIKGMEWRVVAAPTNQTNAAGRKPASARAVAIAQAALAALDMEALLSELCDSPLFGWNPMEVIWARSPENGGALLPTNVMAKPHKWFQFDTEAQLRFRSRDKPLLGEELQPRKFLVPRQDASYDNPYGFADLSMVFWPTTFKRGGLKFWVTFAEKYGTPWVVGKQPRNAGKSETDLLLDQLEAMVQDAVAVIPDDSSVDIKESGSKSDAAGAYESLLMFCRSEVSIALLGQNQSTESNSNRASATAGLEVEQSLRDGDASIVMGAINQLLRWVTDLNESEAAPSPLFELYEAEEVTDALAKRDASMHQAGANFTPAYWKRAYGLQDGDIDESMPDPQPAPGAPQTAPQQQPANGAPTQAAAKAAPGSAAKGDGLQDAPADTLPEYAEGAAAPRDAVDELVDQELNQWQAAMAPLVDPLQAAVDEAVAKGETAADLIARLPGVLAKMDPAKLADSLTKLTITARLGASAGIPTADGG